MKLTEKHCCDIFPQIMHHFMWMRVEGEDILLLPFLIAGADKYKVNHCPSCGADISDVTITTEDYLKTI